MPGGKKYHSSIQPMSNYDPLTLINEMQDLMANYVQLMKTILKPQHGVDSTCNEDTFQQFKFYISKFYYIVQEVKLFRNQFDQQKQRLMLILNKNLQESNDLVLKALKKDLQSENEVLKEKIENLQHQLREKWDQLQKQQRSKQQFKNQITAKYEINIKDKDLQIHHLKQQKKKQQKIFQDYQKMKVRLSNYNEQNCYDIDYCSQEIQAAADLIIKQLVKIKDKELKDIPLFQDSFDLNHNIEQIIKLIELKNWEITNLKTKVDLCQFNLQNLKQSNDKKQEQLNKCTLRINQQQQIIKSLKQQQKIFWGLQIQNLKVENNKCLQEVADCLKKIQQLQKDKGQLSLELNQIKNKKQEIQAENVVLHSQISKLQFQTTAVNDQISQLKQHAIKLEKENALLIQQREKDNQDKSRYSIQCHQRINSLSKSCEQQRISYEIQIQRLKEQQQKDMQKYLDLINRQEMSQNQRESALLEISQLKINITSLQTENCHMNKRIRDYQIQLTTYIKNIQQDQESKISLQKQLDTLKMDFLLEKQKAITPASIEITQLKGYVKKLEDQKQQLLKQISQEKQKIVAILILMEETTKAFNQKQMKLQQQNAQNLRKKQLLEYEFLVLQNLSLTQKLVLNQSTLSQSLKSSISKLMKTNQTLEQRAKVNDIVFDYERKLSDAIGQLQNQKTQMKILSVQLSQLLNYCIASKEDENKEQIFKFLEEVSSSTLSIQGLVGNCQLIAKKPNQLNSKDKLTTSLAKLQQSIANLHDNCEKVQELDYTSCKSQVIEKLKLVCKPQNLMPFSQISAIDHKNLTYNSFCNGLNGLDD